MTLGELFGAPTPTKIASWLLFGAGAGMAVGSRFATDKDWWLGAGLLAIGLSMLVDAVLPGGSELSAEQQTMIRHAGLGRPDVAQKGIGLVLGLPLTGLGLWMLFG